MFNFCLKCGRSKSPPQKRKVVHVKTSTAPSPAKAKEKKRPSKAEKSKAALERLERLRSHYGDASASGSSHQ